MHTNSYGTLAFATSGPNTRSTQLFFNTRKEGNAFLDEEGFVPFAEVIEGMEHLERINSEYGKRPRQDKIAEKGQWYLDKNYPNLTYIRHLWEEKIENADEAS